MSMDRITFAHKLDLLVDQHPFSPTTVTNALQAAVTALGSDPTTYDATLQRAPAGLIPGQRTNGKFANELNLLINRGKAGNLLVATMGDLIEDQLSGRVPPVNTAVPQATPASVAVGAVVSVTMGTWSNSPTSYAYQWRRGGPPGTNIAGATAATYTTIAADGTAGSVNCLVTATNDAGSALVTSNSVTVT
jgi:hypothetical protein